MDNGCPGSVILAQSSLCRPVSNVPHRKKNSCCARNRSLGIAVFIHDLVHGVEE